MLQAWLWKKSLSGLGSVTVCECFFIVHNSNNRPLDIFGLYREVVRLGGLIANEKYDEGGRWIGGINFAGHIFPKLQNYTKDNRATSVGNQLLSNYRKFLYDYERAWRHRDLAGHKAKQCTDIEMEADDVQDGATEVPCETNGVEPNCWHRHTERKGLEADTNGIGTASGRANSSGVSCQLRRITLFIRFLLDMHC